MSLGSCFGLCQRKCRHSDHFKKNLAEEGAHSAFGSIVLLPSLEQKKKLSEGVPFQVSLVNLTAKADFELEPPPKLQVDLTTKQCPGAPPSSLGKKPRKHRAAVWNRVPRFTLASFYKCSVRLQKDDLDPDEATGQIHEPTIMKDEGGAHCMTPKADSKTLSPIDTFDFLQSLPAQEAGEATKWQPPLEHRDVFETDLHRMEAAAKLLGSLREKVERELFAAETAPVLGLGPEARSFCSDSTLLRHLIHGDRDEGRALASLKATLKWRAGFFAGKGVYSADASADAGGKAKKLCQCCMIDPRAHCFLRVGTDVAGRHVIYSCAGAATNKRPLDGCRHMALELERIFDGNSAHGSIVWLINFAGISIADCNPRTVVMALPMFLNNYLERISQIVFWGMPLLVAGMYSAGMKLLDPIARKRVVIHRTDAERTRYAEAYWSSDAAMAAWLDAAQHVQGRPGDFPELTLSRQLRDADTRAILEHCAALRSK